MFTKKYYKFVCYITAHETTLQCVETAVKF